MYPKRAVQPPNRQFRCEHRSESCSFRCRDKRRTRDAKMGVRTAGRARVAPHLGTRARHPAVRGHLRRPSPAPHAGRRARGGLGGAARPPGPHEVPSSHVFGGCTALFDKDQLSWCPYYALFFQNSDSEIAKECIPAVLKIGPAPCCEPSNEAQERPGTLSCIFSPRSVTPAPRRDRYIALPQKQG